MCKHWREYDHSETGQLYERCRLVDKNCACSGDESQCSYMPELKKSLEELKRGEIKTFEDVVGRKQKEVRNG